MGQPVCRGETIRLRLQRRRGQDADDRRRSSIESNRILPHYGSRIFVSGNAPARPCTYGAVASESYWHVDCGSRSLLPSRQKPRVLVRSAKAWRTRYLSCVRAAPAVEHSGGGLVTRPAPAISTTEEPSSDTPLRLDVAARLAFPDGGVSATSLRREAERGNLVIERIAGKDFATLAAIRDMRAKCRVKPKVPVSGCENPASAGAEPERATQNGSSATDRNNSALVAAKTIARRLSQGLPPISPPSTRQSGASVISLQSRSRT